MFPINLGIAPLKVISIFYNSVLVALCPLITSVIRQIGKMPTASILFEPIAVTGNIFTIRAQSIKEELYLLGIINSILINFFWEIIFADFKTNKIDLARKKLTEFSINYPLLIKEILKKQHAEPDSLAFRLGAESPRSSEEAYNYYQRSDVLWKNNPEFVKFIKSIK